MTALRRAAGYDPTNFHCASARTRLRQSEKSFHWRRKVLARRGFDYTSAGSASSPTSNVVPDHFNCNQ